MEEEVAGLDPDEFRKALNTTFPGAVHMLSDHSDLDVYGRVDSVTATPKGLQLVVWVTPEKDLSLDIRRVDRSSGKHWLVRTDNDSWRFRQVDPADAARFDHLLDD